eukprot:6213754-Pleurochrysis_carterae.AAC.2
MINHSKAGKTLASAQNVKTNRHKKTPSRKAIAICPDWEQFLEAMVNSAHVRQKLKAAQTSEAAFPMLKALFTS